jgi:predicted metal-dependent enzyme (double-stranded beta helix superfamily)
VNAPRETIEPVGLALARLRELRLPPAPTGAQLSEVAAVLGGLAASPVWNTARMRTASPDEELLYELAVDANEGPSLYLVSDGIGVSSPPHCHTTWAVISGIRGVEVNTLYVLDDEASKRVSPGSERAIGAGDTLILDASSIHSTRVAGSQATFHLHLYGRPLHLLPSFESRAYVLAAAA